jgi:hypothetical protein
MLADLERLLTPSLVGERTALCASDVIRQVRGPQKQMIPRARLIAYTLYVPRPARQRFLHL